MGLTTERRMLAIDYSDKSMMTIVQETDDTYSVAEFNRHGKMTNFRPSVTEAYIETALYLASFIDPDSRVLEV